MDWPSTRITPPFVTQYQQIPKPKYSLKNPQTLKSYVFSKFSKSPTNFLPSDPMDITYHHRKCRSHLLTTMSKEIKVRRRIIRPQATQDARNARIHDMKKRKRDLLLRINYWSVVSAIVLPLTAICYLIHQHEPFIPQNSSTFWFLAVYYNITMLAFTAGYHKCYAHLAFRPKYGALQVFFVVFGAGVGVGSARIWAALHRCHHQFTDDPERDPYSIKRGFLWAHWGWMLKRPKTIAFYREFVENEFPAGKKNGGIGKLKESTPPNNSLADTNESSGENLSGQNELETEDTHSEDVAFEMEDKKDREAQTVSWIVWLEHLTWPFFILTTIVIPIIVTTTVCEDTWIHGLIYPGILRMFCCQQLILSTESICHSRNIHAAFPSQPFNDKNSLVNCNNPLVTLLTYGQAHQNYHHEFPHDYRGCLLIWALDPTKWFIWSMEKLSLVDSVGKTPTNLVVQLQIQQQQLVLNRMRSQLNWGTPISKLPLINTREFRRLCESASNQNRIYIVIQNIIHDITPFMDQHPGGLALLKASHGKDATRAFYGGVYGHLTAAVNLLATMRIGVLDVGNDEDVWRRVVKEEGDVNERDSRNSLSYRTAEAA